MTPEPLGRLCAAVGVLVCYIALAGLMATGLGAQELTLRPLTDHLEEGDGDPSGSLRYAANRCSALFSLIGLQRQNRGDAATSEMYSDWVIGFAAVALRAGVELGHTTQEALDQNREAVDEIREVLDDRMDRNMTFSRSYYANDPLLSSDVRTCRDLVDQLRL
jgi:hypothetical protein